MLQACGGRSSSDFGIYDEGYGGGGVSSGRGGTPGKGSGGASGTVGKGGTLSYGGTVSFGGTVSTGGAYGSGGVSAYGGTFGTGGAYAYGGTFGTGGAYAVGGFGGVGGGIDPGVLTRACMGFCQPYSAVCPDDAGNPGQCTVACVRDLQSSPGYCHEFAIDALNCLSSVLEGQMDCEQAMLTAVLLCSDKLGNLECGRGTPPPDCSGFGSSSPTSCDLTYECTGQTYTVSCAASPNGSTCSCIQNGVYVGVVPGYGADPCTNAWSACNF